MAGGVSYGEEEGALVVVGLDAIAIGLCRHGCDVRVFEEKEGEQ